MLFNERKCYPTMRNIDEIAIKERYNLMVQYLNERQHRLFIASEAKVIGYGGISILSRITGVCRETITIGCEELKSGKAMDDDIKSRKKGGGRKRTSEIYPNIKNELEKLVEPATRGDPESLIHWTSKSMDKLAEELTRKGFPVTQKTVGVLLEELEYSLQKNKKNIESGSQNPDRNEQFEYIYKKTKEFTERDQPIISVDTKKKELIGNFENGGAEYCKKGKPTEVNGHDFEDKKLGSIRPYGIYDVNMNSGMVNVGTDSDTAEFATESIRRWLRISGKKEYPEAKEILIMADGGGSNGSRVRLWKTELQKLANETGLEISVCHFPPGTSKWNKIEHRMFSYISINMRGKPLTSHEVAINLISSTTTKKGLKISCMLDKNKYEKGIKIKDKEMRELNLEQDEFHGNWNYTVRPIAVNTIS